MISTRGMVVSGGPTGCRSEHESKNWNPGHPRRPDRVRVRLAVNRARSSSSPKRKSCYRHRRLQRLRVSSIDGEPMENLLGVLPGTGQIGMFGRNGTGGFTAPVYFPAGPSPSAMIVADLDGDGDKDAAMTNSSASRITIVFTENGTFESSRIVTIGQQPTSIASGDFNQDGRVDLVAANFNSDTITVVLNDAGAEFTSKSILGRGERSPFAPLRRLRRRRPSRYRVYPVLHQRGLHLPGSRQRLVPPADSDGRGESPDGHRGGRFRSRR